MPFPDVSTCSLGELWSLTGRGAVVTGGARGIGRAAARRLGEAGAAVMVADRDADALAAAIAELAPAVDRAGTGGSVTPAVVDVTDTEQIRWLVSRASSELPSLDAWVNNAVLYDFGRLLDVTDEDWDRVIDADLRSVFLCSREAGRVMAGAARGVLVNVTSTESHRGIPRNAAYIASKHALVGLTRSLAIELGQYGVRALAVAPTLVETEGMATTIGAMDDAGRKRWCDRLPSGRWGVPDDVARVILFAVSDMSMLMTGSVLMVDGGEMAGVNRLKLM